MELPRMKAIVMVLISILFVTSLGACQSKEDLQVAIREQYPKLVLWGYEKGQFTGSKGEEFIAFYEDPRRRYEKDSPMVIGRVVVFVTRNNRIVSTYDLFDLDITTVDYDEQHKKVVRNPQLEFGRWAGYAYLGDYNGNGLEEILFFQLTGRSFLPMIVEFNGKEFETTLELDTPSDSLSEMRTELRDGRKVLKLYSSGGPNMPTGKRDWYLYEWDGKSKNYEIIERGVE